MAAIPDILKEKMTSRVWRINNLYKVRAKNKKTVDFKPNATQRVLLESSKTSRFDMTLKGRQQGVSTYYLIDYLDQAMFNRNETIGILSHDRESIEKLFRIPHFVYSKMPEELRPRLDRGGGSKYQMYFPEINSRIYVGLEVRSESLSALHVSEYGLMKNKDRFDASIDAVPLDTGRVSIESTPMGKNHFYDDWIDPEFPFNKHFFPWFYHHENKLACGTLTLTDDEKMLCRWVKERFNINLTYSQIAWRRFQIRSKGKIKKFLQEHPENDKTCFLTSGGSPFDLEVLEELESKARPVVRKVGENIKIYQEFNSNYTYVVGVDTAEGVGSDYSVASVICKDTMEQVAQLRTNQLKPLKFARRVNELCLMYSNTENKPLLGVERNNHGHAVLQELEEYIEYVNLFYDKDENAGWLTNKVSRPIMVDTFIEAVENKTYKINDIDTFRECETLVDNKGKIEAMDGKNDDAVIANCIALQMATKKVETSIPGITLL